MRLPNPLRGTQCDEIFAPVWEAGRKYPRKSKNFVPEHIVQKVNVVETCDHLRLAVTSSCNELKLKLDHLIEDPLAAVSPSSSTTISLFMASIICFGMLRIYNEQVNSLWTSCCHLGKSIGAGTTKMTKSAFNNSQTIPTTVKIKWDGGKEIILDFIELYKEAEKLAQISESQCCLSKMNEKLRKQQDNILTSKAFLIKDNVFSIAPKNAEFGYKELDEIDFGCATKQDLMEFVEMTPPASPSSPRNEQLQIFEPEPFMPPAMEVPIVKQPQELFVSNSVRVAKKRKASSKLVIDSKIEQSDAEMLKQMKERSKTKKRVLPRSFFQELSKKTSAKDLLCNFSIKNNPLYKKLKNFNLSEEMRKSSTRNKNNMSPQSLNNVITLDVKGLRGSYHRRKRQNPTPLQDLIDENNNEDDDILPIPNKKSKEEIENENERGQLFGKNDCRQHQLKDLIKNALGSETNISIFDEEECHPFGVLLKLLNLWRDGYIEKCSTKAFCGMAVNRVKVAATFASLLVLEAKRFVVFDIQSNGDYQIGIGTVSWKLLDHIRNLSVNEN